MSKSQTDKEREDIIKANVRQIAGELYEDKKRFERQEAVQRCSSRLPRKVRTEAPLKS